ncbi:talin-2-like [Tropilaelaps mercedesae]|uniref:Talin-2-like n=1 Tax=Tropilaelaps mercedesae TaxID=418985 RepID=A0A1V9X1F3_9ACAR|nr:talin-2-like [Tropilaelaps mercedesae]
MRNDLSMGTLSLKVAVFGGKATKTIQFDPNIQVFDACRIVREKVPESQLDEPKEYGLFLVDEDPKKGGVWLENSKTLGYYLLKTGDLLEYRKKMRNLRIRLLDGTLKTVLVDDSQPVANMMVVICSKIAKQLFEGNDELAMTRPRRLVVYRFDDKCISRLGPSVRARGKRISPWRLAP